jgi:hypothetical protein
VLEVAFLAGCSAMSQKFDDYAVRAPTVIPALRQVSGLAPAGIQLLLTCWIPGRASYPDVPE